MTTNNGSSNSNISDQVETILNASLIIIKIYPNDFAFEVKKDGVFNIILQSEILGSLCNAINLDNSIKEKYRRFIDVINEVKILSKKLFELEKFGIVRNKEFKLWKNEINKDDIFNVFSKEISEIENFIIKSIKIKLDEKKLSISEQNIFYLAQLLDSSQKGWKNVKKILKKLYFPFIPKNPFKKEIEELKNKFTHSLDRIIEIIYFIESKNIFNIKRDKLNEEIDTIISPIFEKMDFNSLQVIEVSKPSYSFHFLISFIQSILNFQVRQILFCNRNTNFSSFIESIEQSTVPFFIIFHPEYLNNQELGSFRLFIKQRDILFPENLKPIFVITSLKDLLLDGSKLLTKIKEEDISKLRQFSSKIELHFVTSLDPGEGKTFWIRNQNKSSTLLELYYNSEYSNLNSLFNIYNDKPGHIISLKPSLEYFNNIVEFWDQFFQYSYFNVVFRENENLLLLGFPIHKKFFIEFPISWDNNYSLNDLPFSIKNENFHIISPKFKQINVKIGKVEYIESIILHLPPVIFSQLQNFNSNFFQKSDINFIELLHFSIKENLINIKNFDLNSLSLRKMSLMIKYISNFLKFISLNNSIDQKLYVFLFFILLESSYYINLNRITENYLIFIPYNLYSNDNLQCKIITNKNIDEIKNLKILKNLQFSDLESNFIFINSIQDHNQIFYINILGSFILTDNNYLSSIKELKLLDLLINHFDKFDDLVPKHFLDSNDKKNQEFINRFTKNLDQRKKSELEESIKVLINLCQNHFSNNIKSGLTIFELRNIIFSFISNKTKNNRFKQKVYETSLSHDTFIRILTILIRSYLHIPIILVGDTGVGKTSIISFLFGLFNFAFEYINFEKSILNCHSDIKTEEITSFLDTINFGDNEFRFFDELNTTPQSSQIEMRILNEYSVNVEQYFVNSSFTEKSHINFSNLSSICAINPIEKVNEVAKHLSRVGLVQNNKIDTFSYPLFKKKNYIDVKFTNHLKYFFNETFD